MFNLACVIYWLDNACLIFVLWRLKHWCKMRSIYTKSTIEKETNANLWKSTKLFFYICALLDFYYMTKETQEIIADIFKSLSGGFGRLHRFSMDSKRTRILQEWIPSLKSIQIGTCKEYSLNINVSKNNFALWMQQ